MLERPRPAIKERGSEIMSNSGVEQCKRAHPDAVEADVRSRQQKRIASLDDEKDQSFKRLKRGEMDIKRDSLSNNHLTVNMQSEDELAMGYNAFALHSSSLPGAFNGFTSHLERQNLLQGLAPSQVSSGDTSFSLLSAQQRAVASQAATFSRGPWGSSSAMGPVRSQQRFPPDYSPELAQLLRLRALNGQLPTPLSGAQQPMASGIGSYGGLGMNFDSLLDQRAALLRQQALVGSAIPYGAGGSLGGLNSGLQQQMRSLAAGRGLGSLQASAGLYDHTNLSTFGGRGTSGVTAGGGIPLGLPVTLAQQEDSLKLSSHQVFLRHQIEAFQAGEDDVTTHTRGRNKPIARGQVGIRCRHCAHLPVSRRQKGSTYFPATLLGLYQAAQNMSTTHMQCGLCTEMPEEIKQQFVNLISSKVVSSGAGRPYWARSAKKLGLVDSEDGIRFIRSLPRGYRFQDE